MMYFFVAPAENDQIRNLMGSGHHDNAHIREMRERLQDDPSGEVFESLKKETEKAAQKKKKLTEEERLFHAGIFDPGDIAEFKRQKILIPVFMTPVLLVGWYYLLGTNMIVVGGILGAMVGSRIPEFLLDRKVKQRSEDILFYLPLVIEQIAIGVSSSLDIGPCIARVVTMADERDSHNAVTELLRHAQHHVRSGVTLEEALTEIGIKAGNTELKHAFMSLAQVAKHGGEITRQLQELADAVSRQRETKIEGKIKKLELEATAPVALVFFGFMIILLIGFGIQIKGVFE